MKEFIKAINTVMLSIALAPRRQTASYASRQTRMLHSSFWVHTSCRTGINSPEKVQR